jgi:peptidyl-dipeptidase Dcp
MYIGTFEGLPSQILITSLIEKDFSNTFARHYQPGRMFYRNELIKRHIAVSNFNIAYACLRQLSFRVYLICGVVYS